MKSQKNQKPETVQTETPAPVAPVLSLTDALQAALEALETALMGRDALSLAAWLESKGIVEYHALPDSVKNILVGQYQADADKVADAVATKIPDNLKPFSRLYGALKGAESSMIANGKPAPAPDVFRLIKRNYKANSGDAPVVTAPAPVTAPAKSMMDEAIVDIMGGKKPILPPAQSFDRD